MARLKKSEISVSLPEGLGIAKVTVDFFVRPNGEFFCRLPEEVSAYFQENKVYNGVTCTLNGRDELTLSSVLFSELEEIIKIALVEVNKPIVTKEHVIRYNVESHVSFAETPDGVIYPNAGYTGAEWRNNLDEKRFGGHYANNPSIGGYSLCIGAKALTRITTVIGNKTHVKYESYYKDGTHQETTNPAQILNSWCSFKLPDNAKEIPYTDEAAMFFHKLMLAMATISKQLQDALFDQSDLLKLIDLQVNPLFLVQK